MIQCQLGKQKAEAKNGVAQQGSQCRFDRVVHRAPPKSKGYILTIARTAKKGNRKHRGKLPRCLQLLNGDDDLVFGLPEVGIVGFDPHLVRVVIGQRELRAKIRLPFFCW